MEAVKRPYASSRRAAQARATRGSILEAARALFVSQGYAATTIQAIAQQAGVAVQTVYVVFGTKRELLRQLVETAITGDDEDVPVTARDEALAIGAESDGRRRAALDAALSRSITQRVAPVVRVAREAAASDPEIAQVLDAVKAARRTEMVASAELLAGPGENGRASEEAAATLYVLYSPDVADMLMGDYGWSPERYEAWLASMLYRTVVQRGD